jgi:tRNA pseudouridine38-40 synthase
VEDATGSAVELVEATSHIALVVEYDGTRFCGFQHQSGVLTIQGELEKAITKLTGELRRVSAASRTDAGVHARGQVVSFRTKACHEPMVFVSALNHYLPDDVSVKEAYKVADGFNPRRHATSRKYEYHILNSRTRSALQTYRMWQVPQPLNVGAMNEASRKLEGSHDFGSFVTHYEKGGTRRTVQEARFEQQDDLIVFHVAANSFLAHQVRNTVGTMVRIGQGKLDVDYVTCLLEAGKPGAAGPTAPAHGLYLMKVNYPEPLGAM